MSDFIVVSGYVTPGNGGNSSVLTLEGAQFQVKDDDISRRYSLDTNKDGAFRLFIRAEASLTVSMKARDFNELFAIRGPLPKAQKDHPWKDHFKENPMKDNLDHHVF